MDVYPLKLKPLYKEKIWGGRNLERLFGRELPDHTKVGESWELADLKEGVSIIENGEYAGRTLTDITRSLDERLLGNTLPTEGRRFPLLLKLLDAEDILSLQVHPDELAVTQIEGAALKTECWYVVESRDGYIYRGVKDGTTPEQFKKAIETDTAEEFTKKYDCKTGDFYHLPAGTVHAVGPGLVIAEVQTPSDTTYRVTDWGRGREIHVEESMQCIHFKPTPDKAEGADGDVLWVTDYFTVAKKTVEAGKFADMPEDQCVAIMMLTGEGVEVSHSGPVEPVVEAKAGDTLLLPAEMKNVKLTAKTDASWLEITLPQNR